jgi:hypothetical protein
MASVGRPPELDSNGDIVVKSLVNVTIPTKLANFLKEKGINRSRLFTDIVTRLFDEELCPGCYSENLRTSKVGSWCHDCNPTSVNKWLKLFNCKNCKTKYQPPYNMFAQSKDIQQGCWDCIPEEDRQ